MGDIGTAPLAAAQPQTIYGVVSLSAPMGQNSQNIQAQQTFFPQLQLPQQIIDEALCMGFNDRDSRKITCAYFMKDKPDNAAF